MASEQTFQVNESGYQTNGKAQRGQWVRAAILGSLFGLVFTTSLMLASLGPRRREFAIIFFSRLALVIAGTIIMSVGEFISVSTQSDMEKDALYNRTPTINLGGQVIPRSTSGISRPANAFQVTENINVNTRASVLLPPNPYKAAGASALSVMCGSLIPLVMSLFFVNFSGIGISMIVIVTLVLLAGFGALAAKLGGLSVGMSIVRVLIGGMVAIVVASFFLRL